MKLFLSPLEISNELEKIVIKKAESTVFELLFFGILAGIYIGFGAQASLTILSGKNVDPIILKFLAGSVFSVGLMLVLIPGAELFTGNILMCLGLIDRKYNLLKLIRNWVVVYIGNFIGSVFLSYIVLKSGLLGNFLVGLTPIGNVAVDIAIMKINLPFIQSFCRGILCNMLVCLAVIMSISSLTIEGKIFGIYFPIMVFVVSGYEHSIANMYFLPLGLMVNGQFLKNFLLIWKNLIPVTLGNIIGGTLIVIFHPKMIRRIFIKKERKWK